MDYGVMKHKYEKQILEYKGIDGNSGENHTGWKLEVVDMSE